MASSIRIGNLNTESVQIFSSTLILQIRIEEDP